MLVSELEKCEVCKMNKFVGEDCTMCDLLSDED